MATNKFILALAQDKSVKHAVEYIINGNQEKGLNQQSVKSSILRLQSKLKNLKKSKNSAKKIELISTFESENYEPPKTNIKQRQCPVSEPAVDPVPYSSFSVVLSGYKQSAEDLCGEVVKLKEENVVLKQKKINNYRATDKKK